MVKYERTFFHNFRTGLIKYVGTYLTIALGSLLLLFYAFSLLDSPFFLIIDIIVLATLLFGVFPIVTVAFKKSTKTLITLFFKDEEHELITYEY
jgi:hypothetical protein